MTHFFCKKERVWGAEGFSVFLVPGIEVLVVANLLPESKSIYSSASTSAGPAVSGDAACSLVHRAEPASDRWAQAVVDLQEQQDQWWVLRYKASVSLISARTEGSSAWCHKIPGGVIATPTSRGGKRGGILDLKVRGRQRVKVRQIHEIWMPSSA